VRKRRWSGAPWTLRARLTRAGIPGGHQEVPRRRRADCRVTAGLAATPQAGRVEPAARLLTQTRIFGGDASSPRMPRREQGERVERSTTSFLMSAKSDALSGAGAGAERAATLTTADIREPSRTRILSERSKHPPLLRQSGWLTSLPAMFRRRDRRRRRWLDHKLVRLRRHGVESV
jgi:hypothetical protein